MVDALVSGASGESRAGSSPVLGTFIQIAQMRNFEAASAEAKFSLNKIAEIAQLVEHNLAKVGVASSSLVFRS